VLPFVFAIFLFLFLFLFSSPFPAHLHRDHPLRAVGPKDPDALLGRDAARDQRRGRGLHARGRLLVRHPLVVLRDAVDLFGSCFFGSVRVRRGTERQRERRDGVRNAIRGVEGGGNGEDAKQKKRKDSIDDDDDARSLALSLALSRSTPLDIIDLTFGLHPRHLLGPYFSTEVVHSSYRVETPSSFGQPFLAASTRYSGPRAGFPADAGSAGAASYTSEFFAIDAEEEELVEAVAPAAVVPDDVPAPLLPADPDALPEPEWELEGTSESMTDRSFCRAASSMAFFSFFFFGPLERRRNDFEEGEERRKKNSLFFFLSLSPPSATITTALFSLRSRFQGHFLRF